MSNSVRPQRWQPTRLPHPWDSPGKNTGVGCHFLLQCMKVKSESEIAQSCLTLSDPTLTPSLPTWLMFQQLPWGSTSRWIASLEVPRSPCVSMSHYAVTACYLSSCPPPGLSDLENKGPVCLVHHRTSGAERTLRHSLHKWCLIPQSVSGHKSLTWAFHTFCELNINQSNNKTPGNGTRVSQDHPFLLGC